MSQIEIWKFATDFLLVISLVWLSLRFTKTSSTMSTQNIRQLLNLEAGIRSLVKEADSSSRSLSDQLLRRQTNLERLLLELEGTEGRISKVISEANEQKITLDSQVQKIRSILGEIKGDEPVRTAEAQKPQASAALNIFGEPVGSATISPSVAPRDPETSYPRQSKPLSKQIEKEIINVLPPTKSSQSIQEIYAAAEDLIKAGQSLETIAIQTKLPIDDVKMLAQMVEQEEVVKSTKAQAEDPRLGVLSGMKRQIMSL